MSSYRRRPRTPPPSRLFESLEPRVFLTATPDIVAVAMNLNATGVPVAVLPVNPGDNPYVEADFSIDTTTSFNPPLHVVFYASRDTILDSGDRLLDDIPAIDQLTANGVDRLAVNVDIPKNLASGDWHLIVSINPVQSSTGQPIFPEDNLTNNVAASPGVIHVSGLADVVTGTITDQLANSILSGTGGKISVNVVNPLPFSAAANVSINLVATNDTTAAVVPLGSIVNKPTTFAAHATKAFAFTPTFPADTPAGNYLLSAQITLSDALGNVLVIFNVSESDADAITVGPPVRDLAAQFAPNGVTTLVPGDVVKPSLIVSDDGNVPVKGTVLINYYASVDTIHSDDNANTLFAAASTNADSADSGGDILIASVPTKLNVSTTKPQTVTPSLTLPGNLTPGSYHIVAVIDPVIGGNTDPNDANNQAATVAENVTWQFGNIPGRAKPVTLTLLDPDNTKAVFSLKGNGIGTVAAGDASGWDLTLINTDAKAAATIAASGGADGRIKLRNVTINAPLDPAATLTLKSLTASTTDFRGNILLKDIGTFTAGSIIGIGAPIDLTANSIGTLKVLGGFHNTQVLLTAAASPATRTLGSLSVGVDIDNVQIRSRGNIGTITATAIVDSLFFAGVGDETLTTLPIIETDFNEDASIDSVTITGFTPNADEQFGFVGSLIAASRIGTVSLLYPSSTNGGVPFGIAATSLKSLTTKDATGKKTLKPTATQVVSGDFVVRIL